MSNPKDCIHCCDYEDMGCKMPICEFDFPSINTPKCNGCSKFIKRDLVQVVRCKDCRWFENDGYHTNCQIMRFCVEAKDYCSRGERKDDLISRQAAIDAADDMVEPQESEDKE